MHHLTAASTPSSDRSFVMRMLLAVTAPLLVSAVLVTSLVTDYTHGRLEAQRKLLGEAIADQLAVSLTDHLLNQDILGINVLLSDSLSRGNFDFASVYSADDRLLAQVGQRARPGEQRTFTRDITFQNATAGYVQIGFDEDRLLGDPASVAAVSLLLHLLTAAIAVLLVIRYRTPLHAWLVGENAGEPVGEDSAEPPAIVEEVDVEVREVCVLVLRIRPLRLVGDYMAAIARALSFYGGVITESEGDDIIAIFSNQDRVFHAICGGLLVKSMVHQIGQPLKFNGGIHSAAANDFATARKHASYLASITENWLLTSHRIYEELSRNNKVVMQEFHSSLTPDGEVYSVVSLTGANQSLLDRQAGQLI